MCDCGKILLFYFAIKQILKKVALKTILFSCK